MSGHRLDLDLGPRAFSVLAAAEDSPSALALAADDQRLTFGELARAIAGAMEALADCGAGRERPVAVVASRRIDTAIAIFALVELGAPIALLHPRLQASERRAQLERALPELPPGRILGPTWTRPPPRDPPPPAPPPLDERPQALVFTSGSSGRAKAVELSRAALAAGVAASAAHLGWRPSDRWHAFLPLAHVGGFAILLRCLAARRPAILEPEGRFDAASILASMRGHGVTLASAVPAMLHDLVATGAPPPSLRALLLGGAAAPPALLDRARRAGYPVLTTYGMTETGSQVATWPVGIPLDPRKGVGVPLPGAEIAVRRGRVFVRSASLMTRYLPPDIEPSPVGDDGFLDTGDRGDVTEDGFLRVHGRADDVIITGGENVDPAEVEAVLCRCPAVAAALVTAVADPRLGQAIAAVVTPAPGADADALARELHELARRSLAPFKRPRRLEIWPSLPTTPSGKPDRRAARRRLDVAR